MLHTCRHRQTSSESLWRKESEQKERELAVVTGVRRSNAAGIRNFLLPLVIPLVSPRSPWTSTAAGFNTLMLASPPFILTPCPGMPYPHSIQQRYDIWGLVKAVCSVNGHLPKNKWIVRGWILQPRTILVFWLLSTMFFVSNLVGQNLNRVV